MDINIAGICPAFVTAGDPDFRLSASSSEQVLRTICNDLRSEHDIQRVLDSYTGGSIAGLPTSQQLAVCGGVQSAGDFLSLYPQLSWGQQYIGGGLSSYQIYPQHDDERGVYPQSLFQQLSEGYGDIGSVLQPAPSLFYAGDMLGTPASLHLMEPSAIAPIKAEEDMLTESTPNSTPFKSKSDRASSQTIKEKNRKAQKRFRERQKQKLSQLEDRERELKNQLKSNRDEISKLKEERDILAKKLNQQEEQITLISENRPNYSQQFNKLNLPQEYLINKNHAIIFSDTDLDSFSDNSDNTNNNNNNNNIQNQNQLKKQLNLQIWEIVNCWKIFIKEIKKQLKICENEAIQFNQYMRDMVEKSIDFCFNSVFQNPTTAKIFFTCNMEHQQQFENQFNALNSNFPKIKNENNEKNKILNGGENILYLEETDSDKDETNSMDNSSNIIINEKMCFLNQSVFCNLQLSNQQIQSLIGVRNEFISEWAVIQQERNKLGKDLFQKSINNVQGIREVSKISLEFDGYINLIKENLKKEHNVQMKLYISVFKQILNHQQVAQVSVQQYPFFPDPLNIINNIIIMRSASSQYQENNDQIQ